MNKKTLTILSLVISTSALTETLQLNPVADNTLYETNDGSTSNGSGDYIFIGKTGGAASFKLRRALVKFDLSAIPAGSTITSLSLSFTVSKVPSLASATSANLHFVTLNWGEGASNATGAEGNGAASQPNDATWLHSEFTTENWSNQGGDFDLIASATTNHGNTNGEVITFDSNSSLVMDAQMWVDSPAINFGWIVLGDEINNKNTRRFNSRENASGKPVLNIEYIDTIFVSGFE